MPGYLLDAWALLALLQKEEPARSRVRELIEAAEREETSLSMSSINLGEVYYRVGKTQGRTRAQSALNTARLLPMSFLPADDEAIVAAAEFKIGYRMSYADGFAAAAAEKLDAVLVTGDPELLQLDGRLRVERLERAKK